MDMRSNIVETKNMSKLSAQDRLDILKSGRFFPVIFPFATLITIILIFGVATGGKFFSKNVFLGIFNQSIIVGAIAIGVSYIYSTGDVDISVGNVMGLAAAIGALSYQFTTSPVVMILVTILVAIALMQFNCCLSLAFNVKSAMVAIVAMTLYSAITTEIVGVDTIKVDYKLCKTLENNGFRYISFFSYLILSMVVYHATALGRKLRFIGGNEVCARQTGMSISVCKVMGFLIAGLGVGLAGVYQIIRSGSVASSVGQGMGMDVMLATVLGGMSIFGGAKANAYAGLIGALTVTALNKGLLMLDVPTTAIQGVRAVIFLLLVFLNSERPSTLPSKQQF